MQPQQTKCIRCSAVSRNKRRWWCICLGKTTILILTHLRSQACFQQRFTADASE